jgi:hypothetical protein
MAYEKHHYPGLHGVQAAELQHDEEQAHNAGSSGTEEIL